MKTRIPAPSKESRTLTRSGPARPAPACRTCDAIRNSPAVAAQARGMARAFGRPVQRREAEENQTRMPDEVKAGMETAFNRDFSHVRVHADSPKAPAVGALAYTRGNDIHFAPGQFSPGTPGGRQLLGHELAHVVQQSEGRVSPTTQVNGMPVNDSPALEREADAIGSRAGR